MPHDARAPRTCTGHDALGPCSGGRGRRGFYARVFRRDVNRVFVATAESGDEASRPVVHSTSYIKRKTKRCGTLDHP
jgi:hypothetical protein